MDKDFALTRLAESRQVFLAAIDGLSEAQINQIPVEGTWTIKDLLAHIASWEEATLEPLRRFAAGGAFQPEAIPDHLAWNARQEQIWRARSLKEVTDDFARVRQELLAVTAQLTDEQWQQKLPAPWGGEGTLAEMLAGLAWHESDEHLKGINQWKTGAASGTNKPEMARATFTQGFNCSQAVFSTFAPELGVDRQTALRISTGFGGGMARQGLTCGAVTGAMMALGLRFGMDRPDQLQARDQTYALVQEFVRRFKDRHATITCNELVGCDISDPAARKAANESGVFDRICPGLVHDAAEIAEALLRENHPGE
jgi:C_GCAxxG_C_C family probable redox protein